MSKIDIPSTHNISKETLSQRYYELLYAVSNKYPGESRHDTALRYIRSCENN